MIMEHVGWDFSEKSLIQVLHPTYSMHGGGGGGGGGEKGGKKEGT